MNLTEWVLNTLPILYIELLSIFLLWIVHHLFTHNPNVCVIWNRLGIITLEKIHGEYQEKTGAWWWWEWCTQGFSFKSCWEMNLLQSFSKQSFSVQATYGHRQLDKGYITSSEGFFKLLRRIHMVVPVSAN